MYLFFDTETTGLPHDYQAPVTLLHNWPRLVQIAWILSDAEGNTIESDDYIVPIGKAKVERVGTDVTITAFSRMVGFALEAAELLAAEGISAEVVNLRTIRPMDTATIVESVKKTNRIVTVEEGWPQSGIGAEITAIIMEQAFDDLDAPVVRVHGEDVPMPYAANLEALAVPTPEKIAAAAKAVCYA